MKIVADANVSGFAVRHLKDKGHDVLWLADMRGDLPDTEVVETAKKRESIIITTDADFGENFLGENDPHPAIVRLVNVPPAMQADALNSLIELQGSKLAPGAVITGGIGQEE